MCLAYGKQKGMDRRKRTELRRRHPRQQSTKHHRNRDLGLKNMNFGRFCNTLIISHRNKIAHFAPHFFSDPNKIEHKKFGSSVRLSLYLRHKNRRTMKQLLLFLLGCMAPLVGDTYIHCDWGWGGSCNGYYSGSVFSASSYDFTPQNYFAVKRDWQ